MTASFVPSKKSMTNCQHSVPFLILESRRHTPHPLLYVNGPDGTYFRFRTIEDTWDYVNNVTVQEMIANGSHGNHGWVWYDLEDADDDVKVLVYEFLFQ